MLFSLLSLRDLFLVRKDHPSVLYVGSAGLSVSLVAVLTFVPSFTPRRAFHIVI